MIVETGPPFIFLFYFFLQWTLNWAGNGWTFQNQNTGTYLGIQGSPANLTPVVAVENAMIWDIWRDDVDSNTFR